MHSSSFLKLQDNVRNSFQSFSTPLLKIRQEATIIPLLPVITLCFCPPLTTLVHNASSLPLLSFITRASGLVLVYGFKPSSSLKILPSAHRHYHYVDQHQPKWCTGAIIWICQSSECSSSSSRVVPRRILAGKYNFSLNVASWLFCSVFLQFFKSRSGFLSRQKTTIILLVG